jgi:putative endonuclease
VGARTERLSHVCIVASRRNGTLYAGSKTDLVRRIREHCTGMRSGFTRDYGVILLVWYEV